MASTSTSDPSSAGLRSHISPDKTWIITTRKLPILKADPIEELSNDIGIPIPEMIFGDNLVALTFIPRSWNLVFNARDAMDRVSKNEEGMLQVAVADEWKKDREHQEEVKQVVKPFDWSYSTDYRGTTSGDEEKWRQPKEGETIRLDLLSRQDPIQFFDEVDLYEDELADNGIALYNIKVRMMPERLLILARFFLRLDGVIIRLRDTRVYVEYASRKVIRQYTAKEEKYEVVDRMLREKRENAPEAFRDPNKIASMLRTIDDKVDVYDFSE